MTVAIGVLLLSACDPGTKSSSDVALVRLEDGRLMLTGNVCSFPLEKIELGTAGSPAMSTLAASDTITGWFDVDLDHPADGFEVAPGSVSVEQIDLPLQVTVRLRSDGGVWAWQQFDSLPTAGQGLSLDPSSGEVVSYPLDRLPTTVESCPEVTRSPFPAARPTQGGSATDQRPSAAPRSWLCGGSARGLVPAVIGDLTLTNPKASSCTRCRRRRPPAPERASAPWSER